MTSRITRSTLNLLALPLLFALSPEALAHGTGGDDWPQWRGPARTGVSAETDWSAEGQAEPLWNKSLGLGHSSFAIAEGRVYTLGFDVETGLDSVFCLDASSGEEIWTHTYASEIWDLAHDGGAITTPAVVGELLYTSNREGKIFCFDAKSGEVQWERDVRAEMELEPPKWGFSASPLIMGDLLIMNMEHVLAFNRHSGEEVWTTEKGYGITYSTPAFMTLDERDFVVSLSGDGLVVLDPTDGSEVDFYSWVKQPQIYPMTPVIIGDRIFISGGYDRGCSMLSFADGKLEELWSSRVMRNKMSGCVLWEGNLYGFDESILKCIDLDGNMLWRQRGLGTGSMTIAGGRLLILGGKGQVIVAEANSDEYIELSRRDVFEDGTSWSTPVLSHGQVYCRSSKGQMICLDHRGSTEQTGVAKPEFAAKIPEAVAIVARHIEAIGGNDAFEGILSVRMTGKGSSLRNTVQKGVVDLDWTDAQQFSWRDESGFQLASGATLGWVVGGNSPPEILSDEPLHAAQEAGDLARIFDPAAWYASVRSLKRAVFDSRDCYALKATTDKGYKRTLYFEVESGLYAGHEGDGIPMWTLRAYKQFDGVMLPTQWAFYEPVNGEMNSAIFETATINQPQDADRFSPPGIVKLFMRTPEEIALANTELTKTHAAILGLWHAEEAPAEAPAMKLEIADGFLTFSGDGQEPARLTEAKEGDKLVILGAEYVSFTPEADEEGQLKAIQIRVGPEARTRLVRASD